MVFVSRKPRGVATIREAETSKAKKVEQEKEIETLTDENRDLRGRVTRLEDEKKTPLAR